MILVFVPELTPRIEYIFKLIFKSLLQVDYRFTQELAAFTNFQGPKFSYGFSDPGSKLHFGAAAFLFENTIVRQEIEVHEDAFCPYFFEVKSGALPFDPFASSFYMVSRYEEYLPHIKDKHGRFTFEQSLAFKGNFLEKPVVNIWAQKIKQKLAESFPSLAFPDKKWQFMPTIDIDNAYAVRHKGLVRTAGALGVLLLTMQFKKAWKRFCVLLGLKKDPYDTYRKQKHIHEKYGVRPLYFILLGDLGKYDKNLSYQRRPYQTLIQTLEEHAEVCLHPSYGSGNPGQLDKEKSRLEKIIDRGVKKSRHHFIRIQLPVTYRKLIKAGFTEDYSMGFPDRVGYRAGIASPFYFFDLEENSETSLQVFPFVAMDVTLKKYMHIRAKDVTSYLSPIVKECKNLGGYFNFIFHNESLGGDGIWKNWSDVYENIIKLSKD